MSTYSELLFDFYKDIIFILLIILVIIQVIFLVAKNDEKSKQVAKNDEKSQHVGVQDDSNDEYEDYIVPVGKPIFSSRSLSDHENEVLFKYDIATIKLKKVSATRMGITVADILYVIVMDACMITPTLAFFNANWIDYALIISVIVPQCYIVYLYKSTHSKTPLDLVFSKEFKELDSLKDNLIFLKNKYVQCRKDSLKFAKITDTTYNDKREEIWRSGTEKLTVKISYPEKCLAFAMCLHDRVGALSQMNKMDPGLVELICNSVYTMSSRQDIINEQRLNEMEYGTRAYNCAVKIFGKSKVILDGYDNFMMDMFIWKVRLIFLCLCRHYSHLM